MIANLQFQGLRLIGVALVFLPSWAERLLFKTLWVVYQIVQRAEILRVQDHVNKSPFQKTLRIEDIYWNLFRNALDSLRYMQHSTQMKVRVKIVHGELLQELLTQGKPVVVVSIHLGAFEMLHRALGSFGAPVRLMVSRHLPPGMERYLRQTRSASNLILYQPEQSAQLLRDLLRKGGILAILCDQSRQGKGILVPLWGRPTELWTRLPTSACAQGATVLSLRALRRSQEHELRFETLYAPQTNAETLSCALGKEFEAWILESPAQWAWNYPRLWQAFC